jgi:hypothetical protein
MKSTPTRLSGIATSGISTERIEPRKSRMITETISVASRIVRSTSLIDASICSVESYIMVSVMPSGRLAWIAGSSASTSEAISSGFAPGVGKTPMKVPGSPLKVTTMSVLSAASSISATSRRRTISSPEPEIGRAPKVSGVWSVDSIAIGCATSSPRVRPGAERKFELLIAAMTSDAVRPWPARRTGSIQTRIA